MTAPAPEPVHQLVYLPHIGLSQVDEIRFRGLRLINFDRCADAIPDSTVRAYVRRILDMHKDSARDPTKARTLPDQGVILADPSLAPLSRDQRSRAFEFRRALFLSCLTANARLWGVNAGFAVYTSENFDLVTQNFALGNDFISELTGVINRLNTMGYKIGETRFPRPSHINIPRRFGYDENMFEQLRWLRRADSKLYRRIMRATAVFLESYYNTPSVDVRARVLLQVASFEILFDLPDQGQRKACKDAIEAWTGNAGDRRFRYKYEVPNGHRVEVRTLQGIWADRFYTLRNHIIHGEVVADGDYVFRGEQHHLVIAPFFFVLSIQRMVNAVHTLRQGRPVFFDRLKREIVTDDHGNPTKERAFRLVTDFAALIVAKGLI